MRPDQRLWTAEEDDRLRLEFEAGTSLEAMATKIGRSKAAIKNRAYILRLKLGRPRISRPVPKHTRRLVELGLKVKK
jgi:hypothetical protein